MKISELDPNQLSNETMTQLLFNGIGDDEKEADCIFVFGSSKSVQYRVPTAIDLYKKERAKKILLSGGNVWNGAEKPEAILMREKALELGVPVEVILVETESRHTKENILASLVVLDREFNLHKVKRLILLTTAYHMRRCYLTMKTYMPIWIEFSLCPVDDATTKRDNWWMHENGTKRVESEAKKLIKYVREGAIDDFTLESR